MSTKRAEKRRINVLRSQILNNDMLVDHILQFVIWNGKKISYPEVRVCRLVHPNWTQSTKKCLLKFKKPLFIYDSMTTLESTSFTDFTEVVTNSLCRDEQFPSVAVKLSDKLFSAENLHSVTNCLLVLAPGLVSFQLKIPISGFPKVNKKFEFRFPILEELGVKIGYGHNEYDKYLNGEEPSGGNSNSTHFIQLILTGCKDLKRFSLFDDVYSYGVMPSDFETICLPATLKYLELHRPLDSKHLEGFFKTSLPSLTTLTIPFSRNAFDEGLVHKTLQKCCETLKSLTLKDVDEILTGRTPPTIIQLPYMKSLKTLEVLAGNIAWTNDVLDLDIGPQLPILETIKFGNLSASRYNNWIKSSRYKSVKSVSLKVHCDSIRFMDEYSERQLLEACMSISRAFPHVCELHLEVKIYHFDPSEGLHYVFRHLKRLKVLRLTLRGPRTEDNFCADGWNSLLLGIPRDMGAWLNSTTSKFWEYLSIKNDRSNSITNLTELEELHLSLTDTWYQIYDATFHLGLMTMPRLRILCLEEGFKVTSRIAKKWTDSGRVWQTTCE